MWVKRGERKRNAKCIMGIMIGKNGLPDLNLNGVLLLDFYANHSFSKMNSMFDIRVSICIHGNRIL